AFIPLDDIALELTAAEDCTDALAGLHIRGPGDHPARRIERDRIPALQRAEWRERVEPRQAGAERRAAALQLPLTGGHEPLAAAIDDRVSCGEAVRGLLIAQTTPRGVEPATLESHLEQESVTEKIGPAIEVLAHAADPLPRGEPLEPGYAAVEAPAMAKQAAAYALAETQPPAGELLLQARRAGGHQLGGGRRGRPPPIGRKVRNRGVCRVSDPGHHGQARRPDGPGHRFAVEGHEVFQRSAASDQQDDAGALDHVSASERSDDRLSRAVTLHGR